MTTVHDTIPGHLKRDVDAAVAWFNAREGGGFEATGIVNPPPAAPAGEELRLVLCGRGTCRQERFRIQSSENGQQIEWLGDGQAAQGRSRCRTRPAAGRAARLDRPGCRAACVRGSAFLSGFLVTALPPRVCEATARPVWSMRFERPAAKCMPSPANPRHWHHGPGRTGNCLSNAPATRTTKSRTAARERRWLDLYVQDAGEFLARDTVWDVAHPKGHFQPGCAGVEFERTTSVPVALGSIPRKRRKCSRQTRSGLRWGEVRQALAQQTGEDAGPG